MSDTGESLVLYRTEDGKTQVEVRVEHESVRLAQRQMAELSGEWRVRGDILEGVPIIKQPSGSLPT